jgi:hypothetical protein
MSIRITFRGPVIAEHANYAGSPQEREFADVAAMNDWIAIHIPHTERGLVSLWIDGKPITGSTLAATLRPIPEYDADHPL